MDARELTKMFHKLEYEIFDLKKKIDVLEQENAIRKLVVEDLKIDVAMLNKTREIMERR